MRKALLYVVICFFIFAVGAAFAEKAPQKVYDLAQGKLAATGSDGVIVDAVKAANAEGKSLDDIKAMDEKWKGHAGTADYMQALMDNACAAKIKEILNSSSYYAEIFVMDNQGANVCMTSKTSDYWQGDEAKFKESFAGGSGAVFVDKVEFDESTQAYLVQVSVPVMDAGAAIGAITFGIDVDKVE